MCTLPQARYSGNTGHLRNQRGAISGIMAVAQSFQRLAQMTANPLSADPIKRLMIFGHPAHELALFGFLQALPAQNRRHYRWRRKRTNWTIAHRARVNRLEASYLKFAESDFYACSAPSRCFFFETVSDSLSLEIAASQPDRSFCDAVESTIRCTDYHAAPGDSRRDSGARSENI